MVYVVAYIIPDTPILVNNAIQWGERIVNERLYGKLTDADKVKNAGHL